MARPIDERIVVMRLDNSDFTQRAADTTSTLGKLKDSLGKIPGVNLGKTSQELEAIQQGANPNTVNALSSAVQNLSSRFSAMGIVATTALVNITNRAVDAGIALTKSLTLDQVTAGFSEYETKIKAIKTVMSNTEWAGTTLTDVNKALGELNVYADQTIYNFAQMTENVGRFTAAGVRLEDSTIAIKGLANLAAASGSNVEQLNTAMYQMSQTLAAGKMNLMDWNSLVNAGMGGKKTQDALLETAKAMGVNVDMSNGFRESIQQGWITSEVFLETLKKFGADQSMIEAATKVRTFTQLMETVKEGIGSGWATTWEHIFGNYEEATNLWSGLAGKVTHWFEESSKKRNELVKGIAEGGGFQNIFSGIENAVQPLLQVFEAIKEGWSKAFPPKTTEQIVKMTESFKSFTEGLKMNSDVTSKLATIFQGVFSVFSSVIIIAKELGSAFLNLIPPSTGTGVLTLLENLANMLIGFNESLKAGNALTSVIDGLGYAFGKIGSLIGGAASSIYDFSSSIYTNIGNAIDWLKTKLAPVSGLFNDAFGGNKILGAGTLLAGGFLAKGIFNFIRDIKGPFESLGDFFDDITGSISDVLGNVGDAISDFQSQIKYSNLLKVATAIGILAVSLKILESIKPEDIAKGLVALTTSLGVMLGGMALIDKFDITGGVRASISLIALSTSVLIMAGALKKISDLNPQELAVGIVGLTAIVASLSLSIIAMSKFGSKISTGSLQLIALSTAIYILAGAVEKIGGIDTGNVVKGVAAMGVMFAELAIFLKVVDRVKFGPGSALGVLGVAGAITIMAGAIETISYIDTGNVVKGLSTIAVILAEVALFSKLASGGSLMASGVGMIMLASAINLIVPPIRKLSEMSYEELAKGLGAMAIVLTEVAIAGKLASGGILGAVAINLIAVAINALLIPIGILGSMQLNTLVQGILGLGAGLAVLAGVSLLLSPAVLPMLGFAAALMLMGSAVVAVGVGIGALASGLTILAALTATGVAAIISSLGLLVKGFVMLIPEIVTLIVQLGVALLDGLTVLVPKLIDCVVKIVMSLLETLTKHLPQFIAMGVTLMVQLIDGFGQALPIVIDAGLRFIVNVISGLAQGIRDNGPLLINAVMELIGEIIIIVVQAGLSIIDAMFGWIPGVKKVTSSIGETATGYIRENFKAKDVGNEKGGEFAGALSGTAGKAGSAGLAVGQAGQAGMDGVQTAGAGAGAGNEFAGGISGTAGAVAGAGTAIANAGKNAAGSVDMTSTGSWFGQGFANGIKNAAGSVVSAAKNMATSAANTVKSWLDINSPSRVTMGLGGFFGEGLAVGIDGETKSVSESAKGLAVQATESLNQFLDGFGLPEDDNELRFKAVVDYDKLDPNKFGNIAPIPVQPDTSVTTGTIMATRAREIQNDVNNPTTPESSGLVKELLSDIKNSINKLDPNKPVYLIMNDKVFGQSVNKTVADNYDLTYMKAERGLASV